MKKQICALLASILLSFSLAGCQETDPLTVHAAAETPPSEPIQELASHPASLSDYSVPERFTGDWTGVEGCVNVHADAAINLPNVETVPTATVKRHFFTQADADKIREVFTGSSPFYENVNATKQSLQQTLNVYYDMEQGKIPIDTDHATTVEELREYYIEPLKAKIETAPDESERFPADYSLQKDSNNPSWEDLNGWSESDGNKICYTVHNNRDFGVGTVAVVYRDGYGNTGNCHTLDPKELSGPIKSDTTREDAIAMAGALLERLGVTGMVCNEISEVNYYIPDYTQYYYYGSSSFKSSPCDAGYLMRYVRSVGDIPVAFTNHQGATVPDGGEFETWGYETMTICVNGDSVVYFRWENPYTQPEIETVSNQLLPFSDIQDIFSKMIMVTNEDLLAQNIANGFEIHKNMDVHDVTLSLMRIRDKDNVTEGRLIPVWDFWAMDKAHVVDRSYSEYVYEGGYDQVILTINALDGSIVNRDFGY